MNPPSPMQIMHSMGADHSSVKGVTLRPGTARRVWAFARPYRSMIVGFLATIVLATVLGLIGPLLIRKIFDVAIPESNGAYLNLLCALMIAAAVGVAALSLLERWWSSRIGEGLIYDLRVRLFDHVQRMPMGFFTRTQTGALISRLNNDVIGAQRAFTGTLGTVVSNVITLTGTLIAMLLLEWRLTLVAIVILPLFVIPAKRVGRNLQAITRESMDLNASMNTTMTERFNVSGALLVKLFGRHEAEAEEFGGRAGRVRDIGVRSAMYSRTFLIALTLVGAVGTAAIYWLGGHLAIDGDISPGTLIALGLYVIRIYTPLTSLTTSRLDVMTALVSFERVFEVLDAENPIADAPDASELDDVEGSVRFDRVSFRYPAAGNSLVESLEAGVDRDDEGPLVLTAIDLDIAPGTLVAVVGPSGAGKTTLTSLLPRLYDVTDGAISIDGHDVRSVSQRSLRRSIGVVSQDPHLFHESVRSNLLYANPDADDAALEAACRAARIHDVIAALADGYDTIVGERGYRLSGGEKQRLAIARMLLKDPAIVILDEATSHLDTENEALVQAALAEAMQGRTALVIAHRLSTITNADTIVVLDRGAIVEQGSHADLIAAGGLYAELYEGLVRGADAAPEPEDVTTAG